jgi:hypothetical protein
VIWVAECSDKTEAAAGGDFVVGDIKAFARAAPFIRPISLTLANSSDSIACKNQALAITDKHSLS